LYCFNEEIHYIFNSQHRFIFQERQAAEQLFGGEAGKKLQVRLSLSSLSLPLSLLFYVFVKFE
jgi:hypothetical protein